jgi:hypothetical protein
VNDSDLPVRNSMSVLQYKNRRRRTHTVQSKCGLPFTKGHKAAGDWIGTCMRELIDEGKKARA